MRGALRGGDGLAERDRRLREKLLPVVERAGLRSVAVVPDHPATSSEGERRTDENDRYRGSD
jgi:hypothetical protein